MKTDLLPKIKFQHFKNVFSKDRLKHYFHKIISLNLGTKEIAYSVALGVFIGTIIPIGLQTLVLIPLVLLLRKNLFLAFIATLISNPITAIPFYLTAFSIGTYFIDTNTTWNMISGMIEEGNYHEFLRMGSETIGIIYIGLLVMTILFTLLSYCITFSIVKYARQNRKVIDN